MEKRRQAQGRIKLCQVFKESQAHRSRGIMEKAIRSKQERQLLRKHRQFNQRLQSWIHSNMARGWNIAREKVQLEGIVLAVL